MQIRDIVLYSHHGNRRVLSLRTGGVSVITGASKTGKSSLIHIVDYCLGEKECRVPEGPIRWRVSWFGLRMQLQAGEAFVARRCPGPGANSSEEWCVLLGSKLDLPDVEKLQQTTNREGILPLLNSWCGIGDNLHEPPPEYRRPPLVASIRHALLMCLQPQDEIIRRQQVFHGTDNTFVAQSLKDTLPYFLGAVDDDYVWKRGEQQRLRHDLRICERQIEEIRALRGGGASRAAALLAEARDTGLSAAVVDSWEEQVAALRDIEVAGAAFSAANAPDDQEFQRLSDHRETLLDQRRQLRNEVSLIRSIGRDGAGFSREASEQIARLTSIGIFEGSMPKELCPLCQQQLSVGSNLTEVSAVTGALSEITSHLASALRGADEVQRVLTEAESRLQVVETELASNRSQMEAVSRSNERVQSLCDDANRRALVLGRVSLYLESLPELPNTMELESRADNLRARIAELALELSDERIAEHVETIMSILGRSMTDWARELGLEHSQFPWRLNVRKLSVVADTDNGPLPIDRMGSGANWVGAHLIAHLALHQWFTKKERPVPRFLFLDQPSQIYFPEDRRDDAGSTAPLDDDDRQAVINMFRLIFDVVSELAPNFQVIITEHADINEQWYQESVLERWRGGSKLIPDNWPELRA